MQLLDIQILALLSCLKKLFDYIKENAISYSINMLDHEEIDRENILKCSIKGMHLCLNEITNKSLTQIRFLN